MGASMKFQTTVTHIWFGTTEQGPEHQVRVAVGDSGLCCCVPIMSFNHELLPCFVTSGLLELSWSYIKEWGMTYLLVWPLLG